jgi:hypothetical protein
LSSPARGKSSVARGERSETPGTNGDDDAMNDAMNDDKIIMHYELQIMNLIVHYAL